MDIAAHIGQLVMEHECVIIPGLGGFITDYRAAEINQLQHQILPPSRKLVFNAQINGNDGLLANFLSQRLDISYKTALLLLEVFANYCQRDLEIWEYWTKTSTTNWSFIQIMQSITMRILLD